MKIILCCGSNGRAVVIGDVTEEPVAGQSVRLINARMVLFWAAECGGLLGLAAQGPRGATRITETVPAVVETVWQEYVVMSDTAAVAVDAWPAC